MAETDFIEVGKEVRLTADQLTFAKDNPARLTKEGCQVEEYNWGKKSKNRNQAAMYTYMLKNCKVFASSGKTADGKTVLSRDENGKASWAEKINEEGKVIPT